MDAHIKVSIILWSLCLIMGLVIGISLITNFIYVDDTTLSNTEFDEDKTNYAIETEKFKLNINDNYTVDVFVSSNYLDIALNNLNSESDEEQIELESEAIDNDMSSTAMVGFCMSGLNSDDSPTQITFDEDNTMNTSLNSDLNHESEAPHKGKSAQEIVDLCTDN